MTVCDVCGDMSNSAPGLPCGRVDFNVDDDDLPIGPPCAGIYRLREEP